MEYYSAFKREGGSDTCWDMDELWEDYAKWSEPFTNMQILYDLYEVLV